MSQTDYNQATIWPEKETIDIFQARLDTDRFAERWLDDNDPVADPSEFYRTVEYRENVLPKLREIAGYADDGTRSFERVRKLTIEEGDLTREADSSMVLSDLSKRFMRVVSE